MMCFSLLFFFLRIRQPPRSTPTVTRCPDPTLFRSQRGAERLRAHRRGLGPRSRGRGRRGGHGGSRPRPVRRRADRRQGPRGLRGHAHQPRVARLQGERPGGRGLGPPRPVASSRGGRSEEHTSELQSLMRISYAVFCLKKNKSTPYNNPYLLTPTSTDNPQNERTQPLS